jgi:hypothetical protein
MKNEKLLFLPVLVAVIFHLRILIKFCDTAVCNRWKCDDFRLSWTGGEKNKLSFLGEKFQMRKLSFVIRKKLYKELLNEKELLKELFVCCLSSTSISFSLSTCKVFFFWVDIKPSKNTLNIQASRATAAGRY